MRRTIVDDAVVLRVHDVGESDRFCILFTQRHGRVAARARGVRRLVSRFGAGLLPLHAVHVELDEHAAGWSIRSVDPADTSSARWREPRTFVLAAQGVEMVLRLTDEACPLPEVYQALVRFLDACHAPAALPAFALQLLATLGLLPSIARSCRTGLQLDPASIAFSPMDGGFVAPGEAPDAFVLPLAVVAFIAEATNPTIDLSTLRLPATESLSLLLHGLLSSQLGAPLVSPSVARSLVEATPTCHVSGRAS